MKKNSYVLEAIENIRKDREVAQLLIGDLMGMIEKDPERHKEIGFVLSKYLEILQRSNEQLVKIATMEEKKKKDSSELELLEEDKNRIYDIFQSNQDSKKIVNG
jgi:hypothetical protein